MSRLFFHLRVCAAFIACTSVARTADVSFQFEAHSPQPYAPAYLGNGVISLVTTPLGTEPGRSFVAGVYDETPGDVPRIASAPTWNEVDIFNGSHWLNSATPPLPIENYHQVLDMYDGILRTTYIWMQDNRRIGVDVEEFVSRDRPDSAAVRVILTPEFAGEIKIRLPLRNWPAPHRYALARIETLDAAARKDPWLIWYPGHLDVTDLKSQHSQNYAVLSLSARAPGAEVTIGEAVAVQWPNDASRANIRKQPEGETAEVSLACVSGNHYNVIKFAAITRERDATRTADALLHQGWDRLLSHHVSAWHALWESDILVRGSPSLQRTIHSMLFYLLGSTRQGLDISTAPMGLSSAGYYGHIFWDADTFLFPPLLILHPELARPMVAFRSRTREAARRNAQANGFQGAMYPWEAGPDGMESTPRFAIQNAKYENHINGDVALAAWQYWLATGDRQWLEQNCWPILRDTADFWASRVSFNAKLRRYEIGKVVAENESLIGVSNDAWTNAIARENLELAIAAARATHQTPNPTWQKISGTLYLPESDSPLLWFPLALPFTPLETRHILDSALRYIRSGETGAMMGGEFYPILAAEVGNRQLVGQLLDPLSRPYLRPPFQVIAETPSNQNTNFITGAGAFLQQFVFGYSGLRLTDRGLEQKFHPLLPPNINTLTLRNIAIRGKRQTLVFTSNSR
ncbi:MAG: hypothetical protein WAM39_09580 [Bryobacteraceae bacterium]